MGGSWHAETLDALLERLQAAPGGLTEQEASKRLARHSPNTLRVARPVPIVRTLLDQVRSVVLLLFATVLSWLMGDPLEAAAILVVLVITTIGFVTELRARTAMAALLRLEVPAATVLRGGGKRTVASADLVPGDVIELEAGQAVPADARLLAGSELRTSEASLTGESMPVGKDASAQVSQAGLAERLGGVSALSRASPEDKLRIVEALQQRGDIVAMLLAAFLWALESRPGELERAVTLPLAAVPALFGQLRAVRSRDPSGTNGG